jgi:type I restriction enzyme S subunit
MNANGHATVPLGKLLTPIKREVSIVPHREYPLLGARWYAKGLYTKEIKTGSRIKASKLYRVETGDFVYNRLFAWKGSFAVASPENHGCFVSNEFPCFDVNDGSLDASYLWYYFQREAAWNEALGMSFGATPTSRNRLKEDKLISMQIPLPPLPEQRRIVAKIVRLAAKIDEARELNKHAGNGCDQLCRSLIRDDPESVLIPMHELVTWRKPDINVVPTESYDFAGVYCFGRGVFRGGRKAGFEFAYKRLSRLRVGEFVYPKLMAWEGALAIVPPECDGLFVSPEFPVFQVKDSRVLPEVLDVYFRSPSVWPTLSGASTGTNVRRKRLNPADFLSYQLPLPSMRTQLVLRQVHHKADQLKRLATESAAELDALLPAILDRAFKGEL